MPQNPKPEFLIQYETWRDAGPPKCCHTCEHYTRDGVCELAGLAPPKSFTDTQDQCQHWIIYIPF